MLRYRILTFAAAITLASLSTPMPSATASMFLRENVHKLKQTSQAVVHATVVDVQGYWNDGHRSIDSIVTLHVIDALRGDCPDNLSVRVLGGTVGAETVQAEGKAAFEKDEEVVVFIGRWPDGTYRINGYAQGKSTVQHDTLGNAILHGGVADSLPLPELERQVREQ